MSKKFLTYIIALGIILILLAGGYLLLHKKSVLPPSTAVAPSPSEGQIAVSSTIISETEWQTFSASKYGYSLSYPITISGGIRVLPKEATDLGILEIATFRAEPATAYPISVTVFIEKAVGAKDTLASLALSYEAGARHQLGSLHQVQSQQLTVDGVPFLEKRYTSDNAMGKNLVARFAIANQRAYAFNVLQTQDSAELARVGQKIMDSIRIARTTR